MMEAVCITNNKKLFSNIKRHLKTAGIDCIGADSLEKLTAANKRSSLLVFIDTTKDHHKTINTLKKKSPVALYKVGLINKASIASKLMQNAGLEDVIHLPITKASIDLVLARKKTYDKLLKQITSLKKIARKNGNTDNSDIKKRKFIYGMPVKKIMEIKLAALIEHAVKNGNRSDLLEEIIHHVEKPLIATVLEKTGGNQLKAANILGLSRNTLRERIKRYNIKIKNT